MVGNRIRELRGALKMTQAQLAAKAGLSTGYIQQLELGKKTNPSKDALQALSGALGVRLQDLIDEKSLDEAVRDLSWWAIEAALQSIGYSVKGDPAEGYLWLESAEGSFEVTEEELLRLSKESAEFLKFKVDQLSKGKQIKSKK